MGYPVIGVVNVGIVHDTEKVIDGESIAAGGSKTIVLEAKDTKSAFVITVKATYAAGATAGITIKAYYSPDNVNFDTETAYVYDLPYVAGGTKQKTYLIVAYLKYVKVVLVNNDSANAVTVDVWVTQI